MNILSKRFAALILICLSMLYFMGAQNHAPLSDDLSMIAFSKEWSWDWLNKGLADYFIVYPEYYGPQSNFIRPVSNFVYWAFSTAFPSDPPFFANQMQLLVLTYGMLAIFSVATFHLLTKVQGSPFIAIAGLIACLFIPTFWTTPSPTYTSFVFDGLAITFCLLALIAFQSGRLLIMTIGLTLALMTKEIAVPVVFGFTLAFILTRNMHALAGCIFAIAIFGVIRLNGFGLHAEGVYVFGSQTLTLPDLLAEKLRNALTMPFGPVFYEEILTTNGVKIANRSAALLAINAGIYASVLIIITRLAARFFRSGRIAVAELMQSWNDRNAIVLIASLSALIAFGFDAIVGANYRYAFNFLPFLFIALASANIQSLRKKALFVALLIGSVIASGPSIARLYRHFEFETFRYQVVRDLFDTLRAHRDSKSIVILNDIVLGYANPKAIEILVPTAGRFIRGTSLYLDGCTLDQMRKIRTNIQKEGSATRASVDLPECGRVAFESSPHLTKFVSGNTIQRNNQIHYEFQPDPGSAYSAVPGWTGRDLTIVSKESDIVYFDFVTSKWIFVAATVQ